MGQKSNLSDSKKKKKKIQRKIEDLLLLTSMKIVTSWKSPNPSSKLLAFWDSLTI